MENYFEKLVRANFRFGRMRLCMNQYSPEERIIYSEDLCVVRLHNLINAKNGLTADYVDTTDLSAVKGAIRPETKAIYIETPGNLY